MDTCYRKHCDVSWKSISFFRSNTLKADPQIADTRFKKSLNIYNEKYFETYEDGYLLVSTYDQENGSFVLLYSLSENKEVFRWIPPLDIIHSMAPNYTQGINSFRYYRSQHPVLMNNGDIVFSSGEGPLVRLNKCNKIEWIIPGIFHHSNQKFDNEKYIYAVKRLEKNDKNKLIWDDGFSIIDSLTGEELSEFSVERILLADDENYNIIYGIGEHELDRYHVNQVYPILETDDFVKKGDVLISVRNLSLVILYRPNENRIIWKSVGPWINQHDSRYLGNGKISVFGNNIVRGLAQKYEFPIGHSDIYIYDISNNTYERPFKKVMSESYQRSGGIFRMLNNGDGFVELSSNMKAQRFNKNEIIWEYVNYLGDGKKGNLNWTRYLNKNEVDIKFLKGKCK